MKLYLKNICIAILMACFVTSCNLDTTPTTALDTGKGVFKDTKNAERVLRGAWMYIFESAYTYGSIGLGGILLNDDFAGSDVVRTVSYAYSPSYQLTNGFGRGEINELMWDNTYYGINNCNGIIKHIDDVAGTTADKNIIKAKALTTRGYLYMLLATHYSFAIDKDPNAVCVPIYTEPTDYETAVTGNAAANVSEVFQQALDDLEAAELLYPDGYSHGTAPTQQYMPDRLVNLGLLARTHLYARNWQEAYNYAVQALAINSYLMTEAEYKSGFNKCSNKEWMWGLSPILGDGDPSYIFHYKDSSEGYYTSMNADPWFKEMFQDGDYRKDMMNWGRTYRGDVALLNSKFRFADRPNELGDIVLMRTSEMYLVKAEAAAHLAGKESEAQETLLTLRQARMKAGETATAVTQTGTDLIKQIWLERRKELWGEGFALTDIIRNQQPVERVAWTGNVVIGGVTVTAAGHTARLDLPDNTPFVPNSKYYLFRIIESEELQNKNLYSKYPRLPIYDN